MILVPLFVAVLVIPTDTFYATYEVWIRIIAAALFILTAFTDMLDGKIARKYNLVTDFGKFIDPLADKFMVFGAMLAILYRLDGILKLVFVWAALIVIFRELAITSMRLIVVNKSGTVVAAAWLGKVKTVMQIVCIVTVLLEPIVSAYIFNTYNVLSYATTLAMTVMTLWSGIDYMRAYWPLLDTNK